MLSRGQLLYYRRIDWRSQERIDHERRLAVMNNLSYMICSHGSWHRATWSALGRAFVHWKGFVRPRRADFVNELAHLSTDQWQELQVKLNGAYTTAQLREMGHDGAWNRRQRRFWNAKAP